MSKRVRPKFRVRQVVVLKSTQEPFRVEEVFFDPEYSEIGAYRVRLLGQREGWVPIESLLRPATAREIGPRKTRKKP